MSLSRRGCRGPRTRLPDDPDEHGDHQESDSEGQTEDRSAHGVR